MGRQVWPSHQKPPSPLRWANGGASLALSRQTCPSHQWLPSGDICSATDEGAFFQRFNLMTTPTATAMAPSAATAARSKGATRERLGAGRGEVVVPWVAFSGHWSLGIVLTGAK